MKKSRRNGKEGVDSFSTRRCCILLEQKIHQFYTCADERVASLQLAQSTSKLDHVCCFLSVAVAIGGLLNKEAATASKLSCSKLPVRHDPSTPRRLVLVEPLGVSGRTAAVMSDASSQGFVLYVPTGYRTLLERIIRNAIERRNILQYGIQKKRIQETDQRTDGRKVGVNVCLPHL